jgi:molecular chaperone DnaJ
LRGERELSVQIPPGVATGQYMTLRDAGNACVRGGQRGDVHVLFEVADDPRFERDGEDSTPKCATYPQLALGSQVGVPTVSGHTRWTPAGTQSGQVFHLRGRGLRVNANGLGDLRARAALDAGTPH